MGSFLQSRVLLRAWFLSNSCIIRVPFFLLFGFSKGGPKIKKGKRVPPRYLEGVQFCFIRGAELSLGT